MRKEYYEEFYDEDPEQEAYEASIELQKRTKKKARQQNIVNEVGVVPPVTEEILALREHYSNDYVDALQKLFPNSTGLKPFGPAQIDSIHHSHRILTHGGRIVKAEPRGFAKTSRTSNECLLAILQGKIRYGILLASSTTKAEEIIDGLKTELVENQNLSRLYPAVTACFQHLEEKSQKARYQTYGGELTYISYGADKLRFPVIPGEPSSGSIIQVRPKDNVRGIHTKVKAGPDAGRILRPDFAFFDDIQTDEEAENPKTVAKIIRTLKKSVLRAGTHSKRISGIMCVTPIQPGDVACHFLLNEMSWECVLYKMLTHRAKHEDMWLDQYAKILMDFNRSVPGSKTEAQLKALEFYKANREKMDEGAEASWHWAYGWQEEPQTEISAIQHAYNIWIEEGEDTFETECQCNVDYQREKDTEGIAASVKVITNKVNERPRYVCPLKTKHVITHIDVHKDVLIYMTAASPEIIEPSIINYSSYPEQLGLTFSKKKLGPRLTLQYQNLDPRFEQSNIVTFAAVMDLVNQIAQQTYQREDGVIFKNSLILVDSRYEPEEIYKVCRESVFRNILVPTSGMYIDVTDKTIDERNFQAGADKYHQCVEIPNRDRTLRVLHIDTNYMKTEVHKGWKTRTGLPGAITLWKPDHTNQHLTIGEHCNAEIPVKQEDEETKRTRIIWKEKSHQADNDYFDNLVAILAGFSKLGCKFRQEAKPPSAPLDMQEWMRQQRKKKLA